MWFFVYKKLAQFAVRGALHPRRSESPVCATDNKPSCVLHLLDWFIGSRGFPSLERRPEFWVLQNKICKTGNKNLIFLTDRSICWLLSLNFCFASFWSRYSVNIWNQVLVLLSLLYCQTYGCSIYNQGRCFWGLGKQWFCFGKTAVMRKLQKEKKKIAACNSNLCCSPKQTEVSAGC